MRLPEDGDGGLFGKMNEAVLLVELAGYGNGGWIRYVDGARADVSMFLESVCGGRFEPRTWA